MAKGKKKQRGGKQQQQAEEDVPGTSASPSTSEVSSSTSEIPPSGGTSRAPPSAAQPPKQADTKEGPQEASTGEPAGGRRKKKGGKQPPAGADVAQKTQEHKGKPQGVPPSQQPTSYPQAGPPGYPQQPMSFPQAFPPGYPQQPTSFPQAVPPGYPQQPTSFPQAFPPGYPQQPTSFPQAFLPGYPQQQAFMQQQMEEQFKHMQPPSGRGRQQQRGAPRGRGQGPQFDPASEGRGQWPGPSGDQFEPPSQAPWGRGGAPRGRGQGPQSGRQFEPASEPSPGGGQFEPPSQAPWGRGGAPRGRGQGPQSGRQFEPASEPSPGGGQFEPPSQAPRGRGGAPRGRGQAPARGMPPPSISQLPSPSEVPSDRGGRGPQFESPPGDVPTGRGSPSGAQRGRGQRPGPPAQSRDGGGDRAREVPSPAKQVSYDIQLKITQRRTGGTAGRPISLITNHFPLQLGKVLQAVHYDVVIDPDRPKKLFREIMEKFRLKYYKQRYPAFDGSKNLYSSSSLSPPLPSTIMNGGFTGEVKVIEDEREKEYKVTIKFATYVDLTVIQEYQRGNMPTPSQALQCVDVVLRSAPSLNCIPVGRSFFSLPKEGYTYSLGDGSELYYGFYQSAILGWKPFLNIDVAHKAFPKAIGVLDLIREICGENCDLQSRLPEREFDSINKHMRTLKVLYEIPGNPGSRRVYRVNELHLTPATARFRVDNQGEMTVQKYFQTEKRVQLRFPNLPCLWVGSKANVERKILLPSEFCTILSGQAVNRKMTENQTRALIKKAATDTETRLNNITRSVRQANYNASPAVREFDLSISERPQEVKGRVLTPPSLKYRDRDERVSRGVWRASSFQTGAALNTWTILNLDRRTREDKLNELERQIMTCGRNLGMAVQNAKKPFSSLSSSGTRLLQELKTYFSSKRDHQLIVVVITDHAFVYNYVKQASELAVGCLTQCVKGNTVYRLNVSTANNILLKINAKLDCLNHSLAAVPPCFRRPCMVMGADVTHPSPDAKEIPSVAAVTASFEQKAFKYNFCWRLQDPKQEIIDDLQVITREQLLFFFLKNNKMKPERIIFFRDGVSDGQFEQVLNVELKAIRAACSSLDPDYKPKITFLVVQKRHHTRFFPRNKQDSEDRNCNVPAGTCVDTDITHPAAQDFYLVSHASIQGVAKPTKYRTLWDDADMTDDELEHLTYYLCHMFARCTRSVSYPAPTYYAHLAAARAKVYCETDKIDMRNLRREQDRRKVQDCIIRDLPMYFV